jgi:hypothetical protein
MPYSILYLEFGEEYGKGVNPAEDIPNIDYKRR